MSIYGHMSDIISIPAPGGLLGMHGVDMHGVDLDVKRPEGPRTSSYYTINNHSTVGIKKL